jgi:hypothetical protein
MNLVIETLTKQKEELDSKIKELKYDLNSIEESLSEEIFKETYSLNEVMKHNLIEIIELIHKAGLKCSSVHNTETIWHDAVYRVSDGNYFADIVAKDGKIIMDLTNINNDGGGKALYEKVKRLVQYDINPFCNKEKIKFPR